MTWDTRACWLLQVSLDSAVCDIGIYQQHALKYYTCLMQYYELAYLYYIGYYVLASALLLATLISAFLSTAKLHEIRLELFKSVDKRGITPLVHHGRVRSCTALATKLSLLRCMHGDRCILFIWYVSILKVCILTYRISGYHPMYDCCSLLPLSEVVHPLLLHSSRNYSKVRLIESHQVL